MIVSNSLLTMAQTSVCIAKAIEVDDGAMLTVENSNMALCDGTNVPFSCNGMTSLVDQLGCVEPRAGPLVLEGPFGTESGPVVFVPRTVLEAALRRVRS